MRAAVILLWAGCLYTLARSVLCLLLAASPWRRMLVLAVISLALSSCHKTPGAERARGDGLSAALPPEIAKTTNPPLVLPPVFVVKWQQ